jgi:membrane protein implicated in regulation of membrane protease activity
VSPLMTVVVLTVLWLVVVVPMIVRRGDEAARTRSRSRFRGGMRALGRRPMVVDVDSAGRSVAHDDLTYVMPHAEGARRPLFVASAARSDPDLAPAIRRPVPAAEEATMRSADEPEMSEARLAMMRRRRRSLAVLGVGSVVTVLLALVAGGASWLLAGVFVAGLAGYLYFLRAQAMRDRERRAARQLRAAHRPREVPSAEASSPVSTPESVVRIDDEDVELHAMDTVDLTGLYEEGVEYAEEHRRAG